MIGALAQKRVTAIRMSSVSRSRVMRAVAGITGIAASLEIARRVSGAGPEFANPPGSPLREGGFSAVSGFFRTRPPTEDNLPRAGHVLTRPEAVDSLQRGGVARDQVTWLGHAGFAIQVAGVRLLIDPFLTDFASPVRGIGPRKFVTTPFEPADFGQTDILLLSHNHYDHMDASTLDGLPNRARMTAVVPEGLGDRMSVWQFGTVTELPWGATTVVQGVSISALPAIHFSGRGLFDRNKSNWNSYSITTGTRRIYFAGDTAFGPVFRERVAPGGPYDIALVPIGAYMPASMMAAVHCTPEEAVRLGRDINASRLLGMHWGTISLSTEPNFEPPRRFAEAGAASGYRTDELLLPPVGGTVSLA